MSGFLLGCRLPTVDKGIGSSAAQSSADDVAQSHWDEVGGHEMHEVELGSAGDSKGDQEHVSDCTQKARFGCTSQTCMAEAVHTCFASHHAFQSSPESMTAWYVCKF